MNASGPTVVARQKSHTAASSAGRGHRTTRSWTNAATGLAGTGRRLRAIRATSGGETSTSSGLTGSIGGAGAARAVTTTRFFAIATFEASLVWGRRVRARPALTAMNDIYTSS